MKTKTATIANKGFRSKNHPRMSLVRRHDGWWITGHNPECGPYKVKAEAREDLIGMNKFYRQHPSYCPRS